MRKRREKFIIYSLTNVSDQVFLARKAKVRKTVPKRNDPSTVERQWWNGITFNLLIVSYLVFT